MSLITNKHETEESLTVAMSLITNKHETEEPLSLKVYLNNKLIQLNPGQILRIQHAIDTPQQSEQIPYNMKSGFVYRFDVNFTFLQSLCGQKKAQKIKHIVNHKITMALLILTMALWLLISLMADSSATTVLIMSNIVWWIWIILWMLWLLLKHLLLNQTAFKLCIKSFDFWIKLLYGFMYFIALGMNVFVLVGPLLFVLSMLMLLMTISYISAFDASNTSKTMKLILSISAALVMTLIAVLWQLFEPFMLQGSGLEQWYTIKMKSSFGMNTISTLSLLTSSSKILTIFLWKQSHKIWKSKGIKAVALSRTPTIDWFDSVAQQAEADDQNAIANDVEKDQKQDIISVHEMTAHISKLSSAKKPPSTP
eukprot:707058_1